jgi:predicted glycoside hydrolase/deacetylase ChbG (UPF0249 family)
MNPNTVLKKPFCASTDRLVIIHADDIGMCHASLQAFKELWAFGTISSGAVMVPCPWFPAVAQMCRENPGMDMGVHATLNSEFDSYRWGPVSTREAGSGLLDESGYFHQWHQAVYEKARPEAVEREVNAQIERALAAGIDVSHVDSHMGTIMNPRFIQTYIQIAANRRLPIALPSGGGEVGEAITAQLASAGIPLLSGIASMPLEHDEGHIAVAKTLLSEAPVGITHFILHPCVDTPELRAMCPDWRARVANFNAFMSNELKRFIEQQDIRLIGYRQIRAVIGPI